MLLRDRQKTKMMHAQSYLQAQELNTAGLYILVDDALMINKDELIEELLYLSAK